MPEAARPMVLIFVLSVLFWLEGALPFFQGRAHRIRHAGPNLVLGLLNGWAAAAFFSGALFGAISWASESNIGLLRALEGPKILEGILAFVLFDLWMYLWHRVNHRIPFFWRFHRTHHSDLEMDVTSALRFHLGEIILSSLLRLPIVVLLGMDFMHLLIYETCLQPVILFHHSNVALPERFDRILRTVIVSPNMHRVHHSRIQRETDSNYSSIFSFWDRMGKSFRRRTDTLSIDYGLDYFREPEYQSVGGLLKTPFVSGRRGSHE